MTVLEIALLAALVPIAAVAVALALRLRGLTADVAGARQFAADAQKLAEERLGARVAAEERLRSTQETLATVTAERDGAQRLRDEALRARQEAVTRAALAEQARGEAEKRMADWDAAKAQALEAAKAAMLATTQQVSSKLLEDHKREALAAKKDSEEIVKKATEELHKGFVSLHERVASLGSEVQTTKLQSETIHRALSNPAGAGYYAEIGLENMLREFGLQAGRDYITQHTVEGHEDGSRLRPDAVVFLPGDTVMTVDCKASKYLLEAAEAEGTMSEDAAYADLARSMNNHLRALAGKDYATAVQQTYRKAGKGERTAHMINIMYLPTEGGFERLCRADPDFPKKAVRANIVLAGPSALMSQIGYARCDIDRGRQAENQEKIVNAAYRLIEAVSVVVTYAAGVGKGIKAAADSHAKLVGSINARLLPRQRALANLGVRHSKAKDVPAALPSFQVVVHEDAALIEGEAEDISDNALLIEQTDERDAPVN